MLQSLYNRMMAFADHPRAFWVLGLVSFAESSFFPIPPDPLYIAMILNNKDKAWKLALWCTVTSVVGGWLGYAIGYYLYETIGEWIINAYSLQSAFDKFQMDFNTWGFWIVALKGLTPIPYKLVTIACGVTGLDLYTFTLASIIARGFRFFSVATLLWYYGPTIKDYIDKNLTFFTLMFLGSLVLGFAALKLI